MPNQPKTDASTYRFEPELRDLMDRLARHLAARTGLRCTRTDVIRVAVRELAEREIPAPKKSARKSGEGP